MCPTAVPASRPSPFRHPAPMPRPRRTAIPGVERLESLLLLDASPLDPRQLAVSFAFLPTLVDNLPRTGPLPKFDPSRGRLDSVRIMAVADLRSDIRVQNLSPNPIDVTATLTGQYNLSGPSFSASADFPNVTRTADGIQPDGVALLDGLASEASIAPLVLTRATTDLAPFIGPSGQSLDVTYLPTAVATASAPGANLATDAVTTAGALVSIEYTFTAFSISGDVVLNCPPAPPVGLAEVTLTLTGTDVLGNDVSRTTRSDSGGHYAFTDLVAGTYSVTETQPIDPITGRPYLAGQNTLGGSPVGGVGSNVIAGLVVNQANPTIAGARFTELEPSTVSGIVSAGPMGGASGVAGAVINLSGTNDLGQAITAQATTDPQGRYLFGELRPGTYTATLMASSLPADLRDLLGGATSPSLVAPLCGGVNYDFIETCISVFPRIYGIHGVPNTIELSFGDAIDASRAQDPGNYLLVDLGADGLAGTRDDRQIPIRSAGYDPTNHVVQLSPSGLLGVQRSYALTVKAAVAGPGRSLVDESGRCGDFATIVSRGNHLSYRDGGGNLVGLGLARGGVLELYRAPNGNATRLLVVDALPNRNAVNPRGGFLRGFVSRGFGGSGRTTIPQILAARSIPIFLSRASFGVGRIATPIPSLSPAMFSYGAGSFRGRLRS